MGHLARVYRGRAGEQLRGDRDTFLASSPFRILVVLPFAVDVTCLQSHLSTYMCTCISQIVWDKSMVGLKRGMWGDEFVVYPSCMFRRVSLRRSRFSFDIQGTSGIS